LAQVLNCANPSPDELMFLACYEEFGMALAKGIAAKFAGWPLEFERVRVALEEHIKNEDPLFMLPPAVRARLKPDPQSPPPSQE
jgi:hypothetical protein